MAMRIRWRGLELPTRVIPDKDMNCETFGRFVVEPFERGLGTTIGNSLRRILLSTIEGAAVTKVKIKGADHEFTSLDGVQEDVTDIMLNVKNLVVSMETDGPRKMTLAATGPGQVTAEMIEPEAGVQICNPDLVIATLTTEVDFDMEFTVEKGRGYVPASESIARDNEHEIGIVHVDAIYSPVLRVRYQVESARVGQRTDYDRLTLEIWTNGAIDPEMALVESAKILRKHLNPFVQYFEIGEELVSEEAAASANVDEELTRKLKMTVAEMDLSVRSNNCLKTANIGSVGELTQMTESDLLKVRAFGKTSLREVKRKLSDMGLSLGMQISDDVWSAVGASVAEAAAQQDYVSSDNLSDLDYGDQDLDDELDDDLDPVEDED